MNNALDVLDVCLNLLSEFKKNATGDATLPSDIVCAYNTFKDTVSKHPFAGVPMEIDECEEGDTPQAKLPLTSETSIP